MSCTHIYCGDGKGKTTAALGLAVRAAGAGLRVHIVQILKGSPSSELESLKLLPNITVERLDKNYGFFSAMSDEDKRSVTERHDEMLRDAFRKMSDGDVDMLIIDELFAGYNYGLLDTALADRIVFERPDSCELVLTGRDPSERYLAAADYISEIKAVRHPYEKGLKARKGIEY
ncbi:MAG: cob(I)yrinic acid a,c-diamide adenosyltransferase [Oscillospiraceae bacterium]|nr:cob(I)yrinic acid a,c-diamide adenosyltransferase [Oscillospiraceae bacterium]